MDPVTGIGLAASILGIIQFTGAVLAVTHGYIGGVRSASGEIEELKGALENFSQVLQDLEDHVKKNPQLKSLTKLNCKDGPLERCGEELKTLHSKLARPEKSKVAELIHLRNLKWPLKKGEVSEFLLRLERYKSLFILALGFDQTLLLRALEGYLQGTNAAVLGISKNIGEAAKDTKLAIQNLDSKVDIESVAQDQWRQKDAARKQKEDDLCDARKRREVLGWLYPAAYDTKHLETITRRQEGTGSWFLNSPEFQEFIAPHKPSPSQLWAHGSAGVGKTFISSHVIDCLKGLGECGVAYMYLDDQQDTISVVEGLVVQLCYQLPRLPKEVESFYDKGERPTLEKLYEVLLATLPSFPRVFLVFDALDEFHHEERKKFLPLLAKMNKGGFSVFLTSRPHSGDIIRSLSKVAKVAISANDEDINSFVEGKFHADPDAKDLVEKAGYSIRKIVLELTDCAQGMFLLVRLCIDHLCTQTTPNEILAALREFKNYSNSKRGGLELLSKLYGKAMARIHGEGESRRNLALRVLSWILKTKETLSIDDLQVVVSVQHERYALDEHGRDLPNREMLLDVCSSLVIIDQNSKIVRFAHYTVREFLEEDTILLGIADLNIVIACTTYLSFDVFAQGACATQAEYDSRTNRYPFHKYIARHLLAHLRDCDEVKSTEFVLKFLAREGSIDSFLQAGAAPIGDGAGGYFDGYAKGRTPLHVASNLGHYIATRILLENGADIMAMDGIGRIPLHLAAEEGHEKVVRLLIEAGANTSSLHHWRPKLDKTLVCIILFVGFSVVLFGVSSVVGPSVVVAVVSTLGVSTGFGPKATKLGRRFAVRMLVKRATSIPATSKNVLYTTTRRGLQNAAGLLIGKDAYVNYSDSRGVSALYYAAENGHSTVVSMLIDEGANLKDTDGSESALYLAAEAGHEEVVRLLIETGTYDLIQALKTGVILRGAVEQGRVEMVRLLIEKGASVSTADSLGRSALIYAAKWLKGHAVIETLIENGAIISQADNSGQTALHCAAASYDGCAGVRLLLENGADVSALDKAGKTALHNAAGVRDGHGAVRLLLEKEADIISVQDIDGKTALHYAAGMMGGQNAIRLLLEKGADISTVDNRGNTALHYAAGAVEGHQVVRLLIENGANILAVNSIGRTALHIAADGYECHKAAQLLVEEGADVFVLDKDGKTALHCAAGKPEGYLEVQTLIERGADISVLDRYGRTALHYAARFFAGEEAARLLIEGGIDISAIDSDGKTALHLAAGVPEANETVRLLLEKGADIAVLCHGGKTALHYAAGAYTGFEAARMLVEKGADTSVVDRDGKTVLHYAAGVREGLKIVKLLVEGGADISALDGDGKAVIHYAAGVDGGYEVVQLLIKAGADISALDSNGKTALHYAVEAYEGCESARLLIEGGVNIAVLDKVRKTALHYAAGAYEGDEAVRLLLDKGADILARDMNGRTAMDEAVTGRRGGTIKVLKAVGGRPRRRLVQS